MRSSRVVFFVPLILLSSVLPAHLPAQDSAPAPDAVMPDDQPAPKKKTVETRVREMLAAADYDGLDQLAQRLRTQKTMSPDGVWELTAFYDGLKAPDRFHPEDQIAKLNAWVAARPKSITPRVALADVYLKYAWAARGSGTADTVTPEGWKLFAERAAEAKEILDDSANLTPMCPEWFAKMQTVALAQDWDAEPAAALFQKAIQFEPDYISFYNAYTHYLLPKWDGKPGDDAAFARKSADTIGGVKGDYLYFHIAMAILATNNGPVDSKDMDWARLQRGYQAQYELFGRNTKLFTNQLALFAYRYRDRQVAAKAFSQIGENWSQVVWKKRERFDKIRSWAIGSPSPSPGA